MKKTNLSTFKIVSLVLVGILLIANIVLVGVMIDLKIKTENTKRNNDEIQQSSYCLLLDK